MKEKFAQMVRDEFVRRLVARGHSGVLPITMGEYEFQVLADSTEDVLLYFMTPELSAVLPDMIDELHNGDSKYGKHPGPLRAFGALRSEVYELQTEIAAEDATTENIYHEAVQVLAMAFKFIRDVALPGKAITNPDDIYEEKRTSQAWMLGFKGSLKILDPDGWDRDNFHHSFNVEEITLEEFMRRVQDSTIDASIEFMQMHLRKKPPGK